MKDPKTRGKKKVLAKVVCLLLFGILLCGFVGNDAKADSGYLIKVNKQQNCVTIYKKNTAGKYKPVKALVCSTGYATKLGTYSLGQKMRWHTLDGPCYGQYCTRIYGGVLFHSVWYTGYNNPSTLSVSSYNKLGTTASHGCVRLTVAGAKWIYDNVPSGTKVVIYSDSNPGPLGKPKAIKLPYNGVAWDPTDTGNPNNPWNKKKPVINGARDRKVAYNAKFDVMSGITAKNTTGFDATSLLTVKITYNGKKVSKVDTKRGGVYKVKYILVDEIERKATKTVKITVEGGLDKPVIKGVKNLYVTKKSLLTKSYLMKNVTVTQGKKKLSSKYVTVTLKKEKEGVYKVTYTASHQSVPCVKTAKAYIDSKAPIISGIKDKKSYRVDSSVKVNKSYAASLITKVSDNYTKVKKSKVKIAITKKTSGDYKVVYTLKDQAGNVRTVTIFLIPTEFVTIEGAKDLTVETTALGYESNATSAQIAKMLPVYLLNNAGVTAKTYNGKDITSELEIVIAKKTNDSYKVTYSAKDESNHSASKSVVITIIRKDFITVSFEAAKTVSGSAIGVLSTSTDEEKEAAVEKYVKDNVQAESNTGSELVIDAKVTAKDTNKNIYLVTVTVQEADKPKHNKIITVEIEVLY